MLKDYLASIEDHLAIEEGAEAFERAELDFIFKDRDLLKNVVIISYDSAYLYLWTKLKLARLETIPCRIKKYNAYKIPHNVKLKDKLQTGWRVGFSNKQLEDFLPKKLQKNLFKVPKISGGLLRPFIKLQKNKKRKYNPYITRESYLATIVHEFGHVYWNQHKLWWYSNKKDNLRYLRSAEQLYSEEKKISKIPIYFPVYYGISELYAFCTEYCASKLLWPNHKKNLDIFVKERLRQLREKEEKRDLERKDSVLVARKSAHDLAFVFSKILLAQHPKIWPQLLTERPDIKFPLRKNRN